MPFPHHDRYWVDAAKFVRDHSCVGEKMLAPDEFAECFDTVAPYARSFEGTAWEFHWAVIHKGMLDHLAIDYLDKLADRRRLVFANEVFVVFADQPDLAESSRKSPHVEAYFREVRKSIQRPRVRPVPADAIPLRGDISTLSLEEVRQEMNARYRRGLDDEFGGYEYPRLWDRIRYSANNRLFAEMVGSVRGLRVLDLGCGIGRCVPIVQEAASCVAIDLSDVAIERAARMHRHLPNIEFRRMDAMNLEFDDNDFDSVLGLEILEHVHDPERMLREVFRVLKPGGRFVVNSANRDSLHLRIARLLGLPEFKATREHFHELGYAEFREMIERVGFQFERAAGQFLMPYLGLPEVDHHVQSIYDDPEGAALLHRLGELAGPEYGFEYMVAVGKP